MAVNKVEAIAGRAMGAFSQIKEGPVFPFNLAIIELGTATGFDFELIDQWRPRARKTDRARNQLLGMVAQHPTCWWACARTARRYAAVQTDRRSGESQGAGRQHHHHQQHAEHRPVVRTSTTSSTAVV